MSGDCRISVIIPTRNRADSLEKISLPALTNQTFKDFEVIIWDASDNDKTAEVVKSFPQLNIRYFKAPRVGLCSQRNDAVNVAQGDIIYFIDDDSEPSPDALEAIYEALSSRELAGCSPSEIRIFSSKSRIKKILKKVFNKIFFLGGEGNKRAVLKSGRNEWPKQDKPGKVEWLSGGSMAFRKEVLTKYKFDEELQRFGGWALAEDVMFTYQLFVEGFSLEILNRGWFMHHAFPGGRMNTMSHAAASVFNYYLVWKKLILPRYKISIFTFALAVIGTFLKVLWKSLRNGQLELMKGFFVGFITMLKAKKAE